jgi:hypothetical protein
MGIRETLNKRPRVAAAMTAGLLGVAAAVFIWANKGVPDRVTRAYYSDDDGKTFFDDDVDKIYPFDHGGKPAFRAYVYQCGKEKPFVHYLGRYTDKAKARMAELMTNATDPEAAGELARLRNTAIEVKKPGEPNWVPLFSSAGEAMTRHPICADKSTAHGLSP